MTPELDHLITRCIKIVFLVWPFKLLWNCGVFLNIALGFCIGMLILFSAVTPLCMMVGEAPPGSWWAIPIALSVAACIVGWIFATVKLDENYFRHWKAYLENI